MAHARAQKVNNKIILILIITLYHLYNTILYCSSDIVHIYIYYHIGLYIYRYGSILNLMSAESA